MNLTKHREDPIDNFLLSNSPSLSYYSLKHTSYYSLKYVLRLFLISPLIPDLKIQNESQMKKLLYISFG